MEQPLSIAEILLALLGISGVVLTIYYLLFLKPFYKRINKDRYVEKENQN